ncbi:nickel ABC transporter, ATP-binding protein [Escherichia coli]|uniref:Nickel ABC transporter, ATP-binding protein n=1 Tax=Escherichia coli TaxID=562 RepID=A0A376LCR2_ECOLX|nr:nickel ABC transporter, ATP-binding protein [Escherichia coli]
MPQQIELRNIALQAAQPLVHGVSLTLKRGRVLALVGGSGSGKSLTCAATLGILPAGVRQTAGEILGRWQTGFSLCPARHQDCHHHAEPAQRL